MKNNILFSTLLVIGTINSYDAFAAVNMNFVSFCSGSTASTPGTICDNTHSVAIDTKADQQLIQLSYTVTNHCSSVRLHIFVDGLLVKTTDFLGYPGAVAPFNALPLTTGFIPLQVVRPGTHLISLKPEAQPSGCLPTGRVVGNGWGGNLQILP